MISDEHYKREIQIKEKTSMANTMSCAWLLLMVTTCLTQSNSLDFYKP